MRLLLLLALAAALLLSACGGSDKDTSSSSPSASSTPTPTPGPIGSGLTFPSGTGRPADSTFVFSIDEVGLGANGYVQLTNFSEVAASLQGLYLCQPPDCFALPDQDVAAGESVAIAASAQTDHPGVVATWSDLTLTPADGELGVYVSENVTNAESVRSYFQWGSDPHEGTEAAIDAGFWVAGYAPTSDNATRLYQNEGGLWLFEE